jgi:foldase protein PrsA
MVLSLRRLLCSLALPLLGAAFLAGCHPKVTDPHDPNFIVAETPDWSITRGELDHERDAFLKEKQVQAGQLGNTQMAAVETAVLRNMVLEKLLLARAATKNFTDVDKDEADALGKIKGRFPSDQVFADKLKQSGVTEDELKKRIHEQVLIEKLFEAEAVHDPEPTEPEVEAFYDGHKNLFNIPPKVRASRVLVMVPETATADQKATKKKAIDAARQRVAKGEDFSKVAMEASEDHYSAPRGGDIGYFQRGENEPGFDEVAFSSKLGALSPVFETPLGYQFLKVTETRPAGMLSLDDARGAIVQNMRRLKAAQQEQDYVAKLQQDSKVTYNIPMAEPPAEPSGPGPSDAATTTTSSEQAAPGSSAPADAPVTMTNNAPGGP